MLRRCRHHRGALPRRSVGSRPVRPDRPRDLLRPPPPVLESASTATCSARPSGPRTRSVATPPDGDVDVVTLVGPEPQLRWRTFTEQVIGVARRWAPSCAHVRCTAGRGPPQPPGIGLRHPTTTGWPRASKPGLVPHEGPTGITGVLDTTCRDAGLGLGSLWAAVPTYVPAARRRPRRRWPSSSGPFDLLDLVVSRPARDRRRVLRASGRS